MAIDPGGFIFGGNTGLTYEQLKRRRAVAQALASQRRGYPKTVGEGLTYLGESIGDMMAERRLDAAEREMAARGMAALNPQLQPPSGAPPSAPPVRTAPPAAPARPAPAAAPRPAAAAPPPPPPPPPPPSPQQFGPPVGTFTPGYAEFPGPSGEGLTSGPPPPSDFAAGGMLSPAPLAAPNLEPVFPGEEGIPRQASALPSSGSLPPAAAAAPPPSPAPPVAAPTANELDTAAWPAGPVGSPPTGELQPPPRPVAPTGVAPGSILGPQSLNAPPSPGTFGGDAPPNVLAQAQQVALQGGPAAVSQFMRDAGYPKSGAWCGQFAAAVASRAGVEPPAGPAIASNWRNIGTSVDTPQIGDIAIARPGFSRRGSGETGQIGSHVTFVNRADPTGTFQGLGGNQGSTVSPFNTRDFEFRRVSDAPQGQRIIGIPGEEPPDVQQALQPGGGNVRLASYAPSGGAGGAPIPGMGGAGSPQMRGSAPPPSEQVTPTDIEPAPPTAQFGGRERFVRTDAPPVGVPPAAAIPPPQGPIPPAQGARPVLPPSMAGQEIPPAPLPLDPGPEPRPPGITPTMQHYRAVAADPRQADSTRAIAQDRYNEELKAQREDFSRQWTIWKTEKLKFDDPATALALRHSQLANEKAVRDLEGEGFRPLTPAELAGLPKPPEGQIIYANRRGELKFGPTPPASTTVNIDTKAQGKGQEKLQEKMAEQFVEMFTAGNTAADDLRTVTEMRELTARVNTGPQATAKQFAGRWGIKTEGISDIEALNAMINRIVPQQRVPGTGATSDFDARMFQASVPALMNTPGGNALIMDTMEGAARNKMARSEVAGKVISGQLTVQDGVKETLALQAQARGMSDRIRDYLVKGGVAPPNASSTSGGPIRVQTPAEAERLPSGTRIILPDGSTGRVP